MKKWLAAIGLFIALAAPARAAADVLPVFVFATASHGAQILTERDEFVQRLSPFDRAARMKTDQNVTEDAYLRFVAANVLEWTAADKATVETALASIRARLAALGLPWPPTVYLVKTTGREEGGAEYTRGTAIVLPASVLAQPAAASLNKILAHEAFHVLSRANPELRDRLYAAIGFQKCGEIAFPSDLKAVKLTNPDAPKNDHCIRLQVSGTPAWSVPILYSNAARYDMKKGGEFFDYLQFKFLLLDGSGATAPAAATYDDANPRLLGPREVSGLFEQIGKNTEYIIHPEEILADNFALLVVLGQKPLPSPEIQEKIKAVLGQAKAAQQKN